MKTVKFCIFCVLALFLSILLLGSIQNSGKGKNLSRRARNISICRSTCEDLNSYIPSDERAAWDKLVSEAPELALKSMTLNLHELPR